MRQPNSNFHCKKEFHTEARLRVIAAMSVQQERRAGYSWVTLQEVIDAKNLVGVLSAWRYQAKLDEDGNITDIQFTVCEVLNT